MSAIDFSKIGGSDVAAIIGQNPWKTPFDVYQRLVGESQQSGTTEQQQRGHDFEDAIAKAFRRELKNNYEIVLPDARNPASIVDGDFRATADDWFPDFQFGAEYKTASHYSWKQFGKGEDEIPPVYYCQCAWYNHWFDATHWYCYVMHSVDSFRLYKIQRDYNLEAQLLDACTKFLHDNVYRRVPPSGAPELVVLPDYSKRVVQLDEESAQEFLEYEQARKEEGHWAIHVREKADAIRNKYPDFGAVTYGGSKLSWSKVKTESTSWKDVAMAAGATPELIKKHTKEPKESIRYSYKGASNE